MSRWFYALAGVLVVLAACGGGSESGEDIVKQVEEALNEPGTIYHVVGDDGSEIWMDVENEKFRRREATSRGGLISVGDGWDRYTFDPIENQVFVEDANPEGLVRPRIDHPMILWSEALGALAFGQELEVIGDTVADGRAVIALNARTPIAQDGEPTGATLIGRVELDPETYLPLAFERSEEVPAGETPSQERVRIRYTTSELISRDDLPEGFLDQSVVEAQVLTTEESLGQLANLGLTVYWLNEVYESPQLGRLALPPIDAVVTDPTTNTAELHYALIVGDGSEAQPLLDAVILRLARDPNGFVSPTIPEFAGTLPEQEQEVEVRGVTGTLFTSILTPFDLGCDTGECPLTDARLYRRLIFLIDDTAVQIETFARVAGSGDELNGYNTEFGIVALGETMIKMEGSAVAP
ncbi:MAG: hypothetical protein IIC25_09015 [Chloroflexi bacterium]|nr:hypothetical protein [Chloroflexota bacterium]